MILSIADTLNQIHDSDMYCLFTFKYKLSSHVKGNLIILAYENELDLLYIPK